LRRSGARSKNQRGSSWNRNCWRIWKRLT